LVCLVREKYPDKDGKYTNWKPASKKKKWFLVVLLYGTSFTCFFSGINNVWIRYGLGAQSQLDRLGTDGIFVIFSISCPGCHSTTLMCLPPWTQGKGGGDGSNTRLRVRGDPIRTTRQKAWHSVYSVEKWN
jgi:hypothetical protein